MMVSVDGNCVFIYLLYHGQSFMMVSVTGNCVFNLPAVSWTVFHDGVGCR